MVRGTAAESLGWTEDDVMAPDQPLRVYKQTVAREGIWSVPRAWTESGKGQNT